MSELVMTKSRVWSWQWAADVGWTIRLLEERPYNWEARVLEGSFQCILKSPKFRKGVVLDRVAMCLYKEWGCGPNISRWLLTKRSNGWNSLINGMRFIAGCICEEGCKNGLEVPMRNKELFYPHTQWHKGFRREQPFEKFRESGSSGRNQFSVPERRWKDWSQMNLCGGTFRIPAWWQPMGDFSYGTMELSYQTQ